jgi:glycosyltransferase involved in cell wall biosynthesis
MGSDDPMSFKKRRSAFFILNGMRAADCIIAISNALVLSCQQAGLPMEKVLPLPNGVDMERFHPAGPEKKLEFRKKYGLEKYSKVFLSAGQVEERKGYDFLIPAWDEIEPHFPGSVLAIVGPENVETNPYYVRLQGLVRPDRPVVFLGRQTNMEEIMNMADCFLFCSRAEGFGNVLVEAAACGVPVVSTNIPNITEDILNEPAIGRIYHGAHPAGFAKEVVEFMGLVQPRAMAQAAERMSERYDIRKLAQRYLALYREIL